MPCTLHLLCWHTLLSADVAVMPFVADVDLVSLLLVSLGLYKPSLTTSINTNKPHTLTFIVRCYH